MSVEHAEEAVRLASADARAARRLAGPLANAEDPDVRSTAERALGLAAIELGRADSAVLHLRRAVEVAASPRRSGEAHMSLAWALTLQGSIDEALQEADRALPSLEGHELARMQMQRALILQRLGKLDEALAGYRRPLSAFRRAGDALWEARLLCNRGVLQVYRGALSAAEGDFQRAEELHESIGQALAATQVRHNFGWVAARRGDVPLALDWYDRVEAEYRAHGVPLALLLMDRCEVLLSARLAAEARANAEAAVAELEAEGVALDLAEARLLAAHAELLAGDTTAAREHATQADHAFTRQHRPGWAALARAAAARAAWQDADHEAALAAAQRALRVLDVAGWGVEALDARLIAGRAALELGRTRLARRQLELAAAARDRGPVQVRTRAWHAAALLRLTHADTRGASAAVAAGLRALEAHRMTLGATELRAHASEHGEELATLGLRLAVESGSAARVLAAAERRRAAGLLLRPARPPDEPTLAADLDELRRVTAALDEALRDGRPDPGLSRRQAALERAIRRHALRTAGAAAPVEEALPPLADLLGDRALVEFVALDGRLYSVTVVDGRARLRELGDVAGDVASLRFALRSLATRPNARMQDLLQSVAQRLADRLRLPPERPLVIVPTGELHAVPWGVVLPGRTVAVAPSARLWMRAALQPARDARTLFVAGPRLPAADEEIRALAARHDGAVTLAGAAATVKNVSAALAHADVAHIAAHGSFRDDNPLFTSLELADGKLTVYDLERLPHVPQRIVLSSCESGLSSVHAGDELMGFTAAVFALGTRTVIAAVAPVPDEATKALMLRLDEALSNGASPAQALMSAEINSAFVCFGAG